MSKPKALAAAELAEIIERDQATGDAELQFCPIAWRDRRDVLAHLAHGERRLGEQVAELSALITGDTNGVFTSLDEVIAEMRRAVEMQRGHAEAQQAALVERELHHPFHQVAVDPLSIVNRWVCSFGANHVVGHFCNCLDAKHADNFGGSPHG